MTAGHAPRKRIVKKYPYSDELGVLRYEVVRFEPKSFAIRRRTTGGDWEWGLGETPPILYRLSNLIDAVAVGRQIMINEGEKDVDIASARGWVATTNPFGAGKWRSEFSEVFRETKSNIGIIADNDKAGLRHASQVYHSLLNVGVRGKLGVFVAKTGNDISDHLEAGHGIRELVPVSLEDLEALAGETATVTSEASGTATGEMLVARAIDLAPIEGRNNAGLWLTCQLRDNRFGEGEAREAMLRYQKHVEAEGDHRYTAEEAEATFKLNFPTEAREPWPGATDLYPLTDLGNAERLVALHGADLRYVTPWKKWLVWDGKRWAIDNTNEVIRRAKDTVRHTYKSAGALDDEERRKALAGHARRSESAARLRAIVELAASERSIPVLPQDLDHNPWLLNVGNGTIDLQTLEVRPHRRDDLITKLIPVLYEHDAAYPRWERFLNEVLPEVDDQRFVQEAMGYSLTGGVGEHALFILYGTGANGKSTFLETLRSAIGDYAQHAPAELLLDKRQRTFCLPPQPGQHLSPRAGGSITGIGPGEPTFGSPSDGDGLVTQPIQPHEPAVQLLPTQALAEYVRNVLVLDGMQYKSVQRREDATNVVLFSESSVSRP